VIARAEARDRRPLEILRRERRRDFDGSGGRGSDVCTGSGGGSGIGGGGDDDAFGPRPVDPDFDLASAISSGSQSGCCSSMAPIGVASSLCRSSGAVATGTPRGCSVTRYSISMPSGSSSTGGRSSALLGIDRSANVPPPGSGPTGALSRSSARMSPPSTRKIASFSSFADA